jgi:hypothetical protein
MKTAIFSVWDPTLIDNRFSGVDTADTASREVVFGEYAPPMEVPTLLLRQADPSRSADVGLIDFSYVFYASREFIAAGMLGLTGLDTFSVRCENNSRIEVACFARTVHDLFDDTASSAGGWLEGMYIREVIRSDRLPSVDFFRGPPPNPVMFCTEKARDRIMASDFKHALGFNEVAVT